MMLDLRFIREHADEVREALVKLSSSAPIDEILSLDVQRRELLSEADSLKHQRNVVSKKIGRMKEKDQDSLRDSSLVLTSR